MVSAVSRRQNIFRGLHVNVETGDYVELVINNEPVKIMFGGNKGDGKLSISINAPDSIKIDLNGVKRIGGSRGRQVRTMRGV